MTTKLLAPNGFTAARPGSSAAGQYGAPRHFLVRSLAGRALIATGMIAIVGAAGLFDATRAFAQKTEPYLLAIAAAPGGEIYIADRKLPGIWKLKDKELSVFFQADKKFRTPLNAVRCLAIDKDGKLLAGDSATRDVYRFDDAGKPTPLTAGGIGIPMGIVVDAAGDLFVTDIELGQIFKVPAAGGAATPFAQVAAPSGIAIDADNTLWITSRAAPSLVKVAADGKVEEVLKDRAFEMPHNISLDAEKTAYIADSYAKAIWKMAAGAAPEKWVAGEPLVNPIGLAWQGETLLCVDPRANAVFQIDKAGAVTKIEWTVK